MNWSVAEGHREDESNPAEIKRLQFSLPVGIHKLKHFPSLPYTEVPSFLAESQAGSPSMPGPRIRHAHRRVRRRRLRRRQGSLGADAVGPRRPPGRIWVVPDTKMGRPHTVPLSDAAVHLLGEMKRDSSTDIVFPGAISGTVINDATLRVLIGDMGYAGRATTHGMRACFRTWASEETAFDKDVIEACLAHAQGALDAGLSPWQLYR